MTQIINHFRLITFFCLFIITITYFFVHSHYETMKAITCDELGHQHHRHHPDSNCPGGGNKNDENGKRVGVIPNGNANFKGEYKISWDTAKPLSRFAKMRTNDRGYSVHEANGDGVKPGTKLHYFNKNEHKSSDGDNSEESSRQMKQFPLESRKAASVDGGGPKENSWHVQQHLTFEHYDAPLTEGELESNRKIIQKQASSNNNDVWIAESVPLDKGKIPRNNIGNSQDPSVYELSRVLTDKLRMASSIMKKSKTKPGCASNATISNSCEDNGCLRKFLSEDPKQRIIQLVSPRKLQLSYSEISTLADMRSKVSGFYDTVLLTAASSNHFLESQALIKNLHDNVFPNLKNFALIYYSLGITTQERQQLVKYCNCTVVDFPFEELPEFVRNLKCYSWKPLMIKAHIDQGNVLVWMDASVRFENVDDFKELIHRTKERGFQMAGPSQKSPFRTVRSMYHYFGDEPCAYLQLGQLHATNGFFKRDPFVIRAILEPWAACALNKNCICPADVQQKARENEEMIKKFREKGGPIVYGLVHRYDQSAISLIIHKLFYKYYPYVLFDKNRYNVKFHRRHTLNYFPSPTQDDQTI